MSAMLPKVDRLIFLLFLFFIAIPFILPVALPLPISPTTLKYKEILENLRKGDTIIWFVDAMIGAWAETAPGDIATFNFILEQCREKGVKFVMVTTFHAESLAYAETIFKNYLNTEGLTYGVDYVYLGWIPGYESALAGIAGNLPAIVKTDYYGTPISQIPMMQNLHSIDDFAISGFTSSTSPDPYIRQWSKKPIITNILAANIGWIMPYVEKRIIVAYLAGVRGAAEFEYLIGRIGSATKLISAQSTAHIYAVALLIAANIYYFGFVRRRGEVIKK
ncbi:hypothetical protein KEJ34_06735 [Candidatus Bathyarchaeota archaeon]|nr:hypothetical protein [Candidatus Bathyarchaeota archaeon]